MNAYMTLHATPNALRSGISKQDKRPGVCIIYRGASARAYLRSKMQAQPVQLQQARDMRSEWSANAGLADATVRHATADMLQREAIALALQTINADVDRQLASERRMWAFAA